MVIGSIVTPTSLGSVTVDVVFICKLSKAAILHPVSQQADSASLALLCAMRHSLATLTLGDSVFLSVLLSG